MVSEGLSFSQGFYLPGDPAVSVRKCLAEYGKDTKSKTEMVFEYRFCNLATSQGQVGTRDKVLTTTTTTTTTLCPLSRLVPFFCWNVSLFEICVLPQRQFSNVAQKKELNPLLNVIYQLGDKSHGPLETCPLGRPTCIQTYKHTGGQAYKWSVGTAYKGPSWSDQGTCVFVPCPLPLSLVPCPCPLVRDPVRLSLSLVRLSLTLVRLSVSLGRTDHVLVPCPLVPVPLSVSLVPLSLVPCPRDLSACPLSLVPCTLYACPLVFVRLSLVRCTLHPTVSIHFSH